MKIQFSITSLLVVVVILSVLAGVFGRLRYSVLREQKAIRALREGCRVDAYFEDGKQIAKSKTDRWNLNPPRCKKLYLSGNGHADKMPSLQLLRHFDKLEKLCFRRFVDSGADEEFKLAKEDFEAIKSFDNLKSLEFSGLLDFDHIDLEFLTELPDLEELTLCGDFTVAEIQKLNGCHELKSLNIDAVDIEFKSDEQLPILHQLDMLEIGEKQMDIALFEKYQALGTKVIHAGVNGSFLDSNFINVDDTYAKIDLGSSYLTGSMNLDNESIEWWLIVESKDNIIHYGWEWSFQSMLFVTPGNVSEIGGFRGIVMDSYADQTGHFYDGIYQGIEASEFRLSGFESGNVHVNWNCVFEYDNAVEIDAVLPVKSFSVWSKNELCEEQATLEFKRVFDQEFFSAASPQQSKTNELYSFSFYRK